MVMQLPQFRRSQMRTDLQREGQQMDRPTLAPSQVAPLVSTSGAAVHQPAQTPVYGQQQGAPRPIAFGGTPPAPSSFQGRTLGPAQLPGATQPLAPAPNAGQGALARGPVNIPGSGGAATTGAGTRGGVMTAADPNALAAVNAEAAARERGRREQEQAARDAAAADAALSNEDRAASAIGNVLKDAQNPRDTTAEEALIRQLMQDQLGQQLVDQRASMGRAGFGASGALAGIEADAQRKAAQAALGETFGVQQGARNEQLDRLRTGAGLDLGYQDQAAQDFANQQFLTLLQSILGGGDTSGSTSAEDAGRTPPANPAMDPALAALMQGSGAAAPVTPNSGTVSTWQGARVTLGADGYWYTDDGRKSTKPREPIGTAVDHPIGG